MAKAEAELPASAQWRLFLVGFGMLQITLGAGLIVGWAGIAGSMLVEAPEGGGAGLTLDETMQMFGTAASVNYISPFLLGMILDKFGPRSCSVVSNGFVAVGCLVFASSTTVNALTWGICLVAFGGPGVQTSLIHIGNLFPERRYFVMGIVSETITLSFAILPLMDLIWQQTNASFQYIFGFYAVIMAASACMSWILWPDAPYVAPLEAPKPVKPVKPPPPTSTMAKQPLNSYLREDTAKVEQSESFLESEKVLLQGHPDAVSLKDMPFDKQLTSGVYLRVSLFFFVTSFWANYYIATVTTELGDLQKFDADKQHELARLLSFIDAAAIVCAPLSGYLIEEVGFSPTAVITVVIGMVQMVLLIVANGSEAIMITSFVFYAVFRAFLFPYFFASLSRKTGFKYFGMLTGIAFCGSGVSQLGIAPLATVVEGTCHEYDASDGDCSEGAWTFVHYVQLVFLAFLLLVPLVDVYVESREANPTLLDEASETKALTDTAQNSSYGSIQPEEAMSTTSAQEQSQPPIPKPESQEQSESSVGDQFLL